MQVTVTGGAGFIGSAVVREAARAGHDVVVLDNLTTGYLSNLSGLTGVRLVEGDVRDPARLEEALQGSEGVFHLAACVGNVRSIEDPLQDADINVRGTLWLLEAMRHRGIRRLVYSSSAALYGESDHLPVEESHSCEPESPYGVSKLAAEKYCLCYGRLYGWSVACLRYFNVYGERQRFDAYGNVIPIFAHHLLAGSGVTVYGDGLQTRDFVNVEDVARANVRALEARASGVFNVATGHGSTIESLARAMVKLSGGGAEVVYGPPRPGEVRHSRASVAAAKQAFGYEPRVGLEEGLAAYLDWMRQDVAPGKPASAGPHD
jgi:UDP-glucose 4-epimerase